MKITARLALAVVAIGSAYAAHPADAQTIVTLGTPLTGPRSLTLDSQRNVIVSTSDFNIEEIAAAGNYATVSPVGNGLTLPTSVAVDAAGDIFVLDTDHNSVRKFLASSFPNPSFSGSLLITGNFKAPAGIALDASGNLFVADTGNGVVKELLAPGYTTVATVGSGFTAPHGVALDANANLFVADAGANAVVEFKAPAYTAATTLGSGFSAPAGVAVDKAGDVFVADAGNNAVKEIPKGGSLVTLGSGFKAPGGVSVDSNANLFVADTGNSAVKELTKASSYATTLTLGPPGPGAFKQPAGIVVDSSADVFVADTGTATIKAMLVAFPNYEIVDTLISGLPLGQPFGVAVATSTTVGVSDNVFFADTADSVIKEIVGASQDTIIDTLGAVITGPGGVTLDASANIFVADAANVYEFTAASNYTTKKVLGTGFNHPLRLAVDASGDVFVADTGNNAVKEILPSGAQKTLGGGFNQPSGIALDAAGDVFVADSGNDEVKELTVAGGFATAAPVGSGFNHPADVAVDGSGNIFVADEGNNAVKEILAAPATVFAAVLPGSRSVEVGHPATIFASMVNSGTATLNDCSVSLPASAPAGLTMSYQTTNPATNALTGKPNTPTTLPGNNGLATFFLAFQGTAPFSAPGLPLDFNCAGTGLIQTAAIVPGVDTVDLVMSATPIADIIALAATPTNNGVISVPVNGAAAFAVASFNVSVTGNITVSADTGAATLPATLSICQSNPANGQCLAPPSPTVSLSYAGGAAPTFSIFVTSTAAIPFSPATSRVFVRFEDSTGGLHGSTSVAIDSP